MTKTEHLRPIQAIARLLKLSSNPQHTWKQASLDLEAISGIRISGAYLFQVYTGKRDASNQLRAALGIALKPVLVAPCPKHGVVHIMPHCPRAKAQRKPAINQWRRLSELSAPDNKDYWYWIADQKPAFGQPLLCNLDRKSWDYLRGVFGIRQVWMRRALLPKPPRMKGEA